MKIIITLVLISSCQKFSTKNEGACVVINGQAANFTESDLIKLKAEAPATLTRDSSARLLFDILRAERVMRPAKISTSMKERLRIYEDFLKEFPDPVLGLRKLDEIKNIEKGPCFLRKL